MQDMHAIAGGGGGGGGRVFGDRRLRVHHQQNQALKCPRCDSLNTKFCYYNNYNLSQPRHFCKSCRRYWTKGGVLRNVPVGGGCRKSKRGSSKQKSASEKRAGKSGLCTERKSGCQSHTSSGSESTSGLATATATTPTTASISKSPSANADLSYSSSISMKKMIMNETTSETTSTLAQTYTNTGILNFSNHHPHQKFVIPASGYTVSSNFESLIGQNSTDNAPGGIFPEIGSLMSLMDNTHTKTPLKLQIGGEDNKFAHSLQLQDWQAMEEEVKIQGLGGGILDQTITEQTDLWQSKNNDGGLVGFDWQAAAPGGGHHDGDDQVGLFQLPASVDQSANWSHSCTEWCGNDHPLFLP